MLEAGISDRGTQFGIPSDQVALDLPGLFRHVVEIHANGLSRGTRRSQYMERSDDARFKMAALRRFDHPGCLKFFAPVRS